MMDKILGNFLIQANKDFPLDCETLDYLQQLSALAAIAGNIAGDRVVLWGCAPNSEGTRRAEGYVFVRTKDMPEGEVLYWEGGPTTSGMYIRQEDVSVNANNTDYPKAYTRRSLAPGIGVESYKWTEFTDIKTIKEIMAENESLRGELANAQPSPLGAVLMWAGAIVPEGYLLCNGQQYRTTDYPELYKALGTTFNNTMSASGTVYQTDAGYFRVPDLRGRFVVGLHDYDNDYKIKGMAGGAKSVALTVEQMPAHAHRMKDYYHAEKSNLARDNYDSMEINSKVGSGDTDYDNNTLQWVKHDTETAGGGNTHENRPPYYVLAYIMRAK